MMRRLKDDKGITLVALAVTIIIMTILVGITVRSVVGDNGLITQSKQIAQNTIAAKSEAQTKINALKGEESYREDGTVILQDEDAPIINSLIVTDKLDGISNNSLTINVNITEAQSGIAKIEYSIDDGATYVTPLYNQEKTYVFENLKSNTEYNVKVRITDEAGNEIIASKTVTTTGLKIGDYVNYAYDIVADGYTLLASQSGYSDQTVGQSSRTLKWRILNIDEESGKIELVSESPTSNTVYFQGALGYNNGVYLLNEMCAALYSNRSKGITARSINLEDTEKHLTETGLAARNAYTQSSSGTQYGSTKTYTDSKSYYPNLYAQEIGSGVNVVEANASSISQPEKSINNPDPYKESKGYYTSPTTETYTQASEKALTVTQTYYNGVTFNEANYGEAGAVLTSSDIYWVASRSADCWPGNANFGLRFAFESMAGRSMFYSNNGTYYASFRLRPVVSLESNVLDGTKDASGAWNLK